MVVKFVIKFTKEMRSDANISKKTRKMRAISLMISIMNSKITWDQNISIKSSAKILRIRKCVKKRFAKLSKNLSTINISRITRRRDLWSIGIRIITILIRSYSLFWLLNKQWFMHCINTKFNLINILSFFTWISFFCSFIFIWENFF